MSAWTIPSYAEWAVPGYTEERLLGHGVSGRVVEAVSDATGQRVAIKYLNASLVDDSAFIWELRSQVEQLRALDAAHMVRVFDYAEQPGQAAAIVMELVDGVSLREMITRRGPLAPPAALVMLKDALLALAAAHSRRIAHRDVKPENVLADTRGWCTLTDFGVAVKTDKHMPAAGAPPYMAPDLWNGSPYVPATDIYAAAAVFAESLTGKPPFSGRPAQLRELHQSEPVPLAQYAEPLQDLIAWGMAKNPAERPRSARAFLHEIEGRAAAVYGPYWEDAGRRELADRCAEVLPLLADGGGGSATVTRMARRRVITVLAVAGAAVVALGTAGAVALSRSSPNAQLSSAATSTFTAQTTVTPPVAASRCTAATTFTYKGTVTATKPGKLTYRWQYSTGKQGPVETLSFAAAGHQVVSGGTVSSVKASSGWGEIKVLTPVPETSAKAPYKLLCGTGTTGLNVSAAVSPAAQTVSSCAAPAPALTASGSITSTRAQTVSYYWALANGTDSAARMLTFTAAGTRTATPFTFTPAALPATGDAVLVVTKPGAAASSPASYSVSCTVPVSTVPVSTVSTAPATSARPIIPATSAKASASTSAKPSTSKSSSPSPSKSTSPRPTKSSAPPTTAPPTPTPTPPPPTSAPPPSTSAPPGTEAPPSDTASALTTDPATGGLNLPPP